MLNNMATSGENQVLSSVERALLAVEVVAEHQAINVTQLARQLDVGKATAFRLARTLVARDWLVKDADRNYRLGPAIALLNGSASAAPDLRTELAPILEQLHAETSETIHLARLQGRKIVYVEQLVSPKPVLSVSVIGGSSPAHCV